MKGEIMPGGMGRGRGGGRQKLFFMESCLLVLLSRGEGYGYGLMEGLGEFGFLPEGMDISILYRSLRDLEAQGLVTSAWDEKSLGPQRRVYRLAQEGREVLGLWMKELGNRRRGIEALEVAYGALEPPQTKGEREKI